MNKTAIRRFLYYLMWVVGIGAIVFAYQSKNLDVKLQAGLLGGFIIEVLLLHTLWFWKICIGIVFLVFKTLKWVFNTIQGGQSEQMPPTEQLVLNGPWKYQEITDDEKIVTLAMLDKTATGKQQVYLTMLPFEWYGDIDRALSITREMNDFTILDPEDKPSMSLDFFARNILDYDVRDIILPAKEGSIFLTPQECSDWQDRPDWSWESFHKIYAESEGLISFSRPGFNQSKTKALIYVSEIWHDLSSQTSFSYFAKENGVWKYERGHIVGVT